MIKPWDMPRINEEFRRIWDVLRGREGRLDSNEALRELLTVEEPANDRLRWFAVWLEKTVLPDWEIIRNLYFKAVRLDPHDTRLLRSWAFATINYANFIPRKTSGLCCWSGSELRRVPCV
ncbi:MAG: hypothetical protein ACM3QW_07605 [Ignavibacteriales bacterium]